ncbi:DDB1- and CUL4-associated factor 5 [Patella vulgata]|uniref:DDB1- and CUL4-associated factor 5 n=1 Tax=Patella vulgata TaxID=6465 RepID=UPI0024A9C6AD|nr:DDB1- and CUL4-associated factor 5 [Patella vulgata]
MCTALGNRKSELTFKKEYGCISFINNRIYGLNPSNFQRLLREKLALATGLYQTDLKAHYGCVNAIEFSNNGGEMIASGGDDRRVLLWNTQRAISNNGSPAIMKSEHRSNIFSLAFDKDNEKIFSGGNDEQVFVHDAATGNPVDNFMHEDAVYGLSTDPNNSNVFASACDDGRVLIYDIREPADSEPFCLANYVSSMHAVMYNPTEPRLLATANAREGIGLWDIRKPRSCLMRYGGEFEQQSCMSVRINGMGNQILALRRRLPPVIYNIHSSKPVAEFEHMGYFNSCTMKSCCFAGDRDQYVVSGSDDFNVYVWKIPDDLSERVYVNSAHLVLKGHRSIVNQVRSNIDTGLILSSGVEKTIKAWSPFPLKKIDPETNTEIEPIERPVYTHEEYINLVLRSGHVMSHDYTQHSTEEDPRMMAFFDSLVQREMETWSSSEEFSSNEEELYDRILQVSRAESQDVVIPRIAEELISDNSDDGLSPFTLAFASVMAAQTAEQSNTSRLLDVEDSTESENNETNADGTEMPNNTNRRSISDIIANNKKETLMKNMEAKKKMKCKRTLKRHIVSDSDSDNDTNPGFSHEKLQKLMDGPGECSTSATTVSNNTNSKKGNIKFHLKKLRDLRSQILNSDSESNDNSHASLCDINQSDVGVPVSAELPSSTVTSCKDHSDASNAYGPFLHETNVSVITSSMDVNKTNQEQSNVRNNMNFPRNNNTNENCDNTYDQQINNNVDSDQNPLSKHGRNNDKMDDNSDKLTAEDRERSKRHSNGPQNNSRHLRNVSSTSSSSQEANNTNLDSDDTTSGISSEVNTEQIQRTLDSAKPVENMSCQSTSSDPGNKTVNNGTDSEPTWNEFKRYKKKLERAHRYYRRHSGSQASSDEDI